MFNTPVDAEETARHFFTDIFSSGEVDAILDALSDDMTWWVSGKIEGMSGSYAKAGFGALIGGVADVYEAPLRITPKTVHVSGNSVIVKTQSYAKLKDGRVYDPADIFVVHVGPDGRLLRVHEYLDTLHAHDIFFSA
jgi:ketosteroid isomerase-like protein